MDPNEAAANLAAEIDRLKEFGWALGCPRDQNPLREQLRAVEVVLAERERLRAALDGVRALRLPLPAAQAVKDISANLAPLTGCDAALMRYQSHAEALAEAVAPLVGPWSSEHEQTPQQRDAEHALRRFLLTRDELRAIERGEGR